MSRLYDDASSHTSTVNSTPVTAAPFTMAGWGRTDDNTTQGTWCSVCDKDVSNNMFDARINGSSSGRNEARIEDSGGSSSSAGTTTNASNNVWYHLAAVYESSTSRHAYIGGGSKGSGTASRSPTGSDRVAVGSKGVASDGEFFSGRIGHVAIWNVALSDQEVASLAAGVLPLRMRREALVFYCPQNGNSSPETEIMGARNMTLTGPPTKAEDPPIPGFFRTA